MYEPFVICRLSVFCKVTLIRNISILREHFIIFIKVYAFKHHSVRNLITTLLRFSDPSDFVTLFPPHLCHYSAIKVDFLPVSLFFYVCSPSLLSSQDNN